MICAAVQLTHGHTHRQGQLLTGYTISSANWAKKSSDDSYR